jgi:hypothetical protein
MIPTYKACYLRSYYVTLTDAEYLEAFQRGEAIYESSQRRNLRDHRAFVRKGIDGRRVQAIGEVAVRAVAKLLGLEWLDSMDTFKGADLHHNIEVRLIGREWYGLRVYDRDDNSRCVVGCVIEQGKEREAYRVPGWIKAKEGKKREWLADPLERHHPVYLVPQDYLLSLDELGLPIVGGWTKPPETSYILQDRDGDYVLNVESTEWETVKVHFAFTKDRSAARVFTYKELLWNQATNPLGLEFIRGFAGGRLVRL